MKLSDLNIGPIFDNMIFRYLTCGTIASIVQITTLYLLVQGLHAHKTILSCLAFILAVFVNYSLQKSFTFNSGAPHSILFPKFATVAVFGFCLNAVIFSVFALYMNYIVAQVITIFVVLVFNFILNKRFVFS
jgi:putative flippase GtrA